MISNQICIPDRSLPKLKNGVTPIRSAQSQSGQTQPVSCPTIKGVIGQTYSYYKGKNINTNNSHLQIFSLSFQTNLDQFHKNMSDVNQNPGSHLIKNQMVGQNRYVTFEKFNRRHRAGILDTSFLLNRLANNKNNKGSMRMRNPRQAYIEIQRINRSQRVRAEIMNRIGNKNREKKNITKEGENTANNNNNNDNREKIDTQFSKILEESQQTIQENPEDVAIPQKTLSKKESETQNFTVHRSKLKGVRCLRFTEKEESEKDNKQQENDIVIFNTSKIEEQEGSRLYATRTNLIEYETINKRIRSINYPSPHTRSYKFCIGPGNNGEIIKEILEKRGNWKATSEHDTLFHLRWQQITEKSFYHRLNFSRYKQLINHAVAHEHISTKSGLVETLKHFLQRYQTNSKLKIQQSLHCFDLLPVSFAFDWSDKNKFQEELKRFIFYYCQNHPMPERSYRKERDYVDLIKDIFGQRTRNLNLTMNKNELMRRNYLPFLTDVYKSQESQYLWIIKPSEMNRGRGIKIFSKLEDLAKILKETLTSGDFVIQKYIQKPMLLRNRKFDIRVWVLVDSDGHGYFFEEGYIRTSSEEFTMKEDHKNNEYVHLTNNAVQKKSNNYGLYEDGNQLSFDSFDKLSGKPVNYFRNNLLPTIKDLCSLVMQAGMKKKMMGHIEKNLPNLKDSPNKINKDKIDKKIINDLNGENSFNLNIAKNTFEIFGFDYMIDKNQKLWLIEVNTNPCIETSSKMLEALIPRMLDDAFKKVVDPIFKPSLIQNYHVDGYEDQQNLWKQLNGNVEQIINRLKNPVAFLNPEKSQEKNDEETGVAGVAGETEENERKNSQSPSGRDSEGLQ